MTIDSGTWFQVSATLFVKKSLLALFVQSCFVILWEDLLTLEAGPSPIVKLLVLILSSPCKEAKLIFFIDFKELD